MSLHVPSLPRSARRSALPLALGAAALFALPAGSASAAPVQRTFTAQGCTVGAFTVPAAVDSVHVVATGATGAPGSGLGGVGATVEADLAVTAGDALDICINVGGGAGGTPVSTWQNGNPGGGLSSVSSSTALDFIVAAGGGGSGGDGGNGGRGGAGGLLGEAGGNGGQGRTSLGLGGGGATVAVPGAGGTHPDFTTGATAGGALVGGTGGNGDPGTSGSGGGGGGAGVQGGGGGSGGRRFSSAGQYGAGGGGGASACTAPATACTSRAGGSSASVVISYNVQTSVTVTANVAPDPVGRGNPVTYQASFGAPVSDGTVTFSVDGDAIAACTDLPVAGVAVVCPTTAPATGGAHTLTVAYSGGADFLPAGDDAEFTVQTPVATVTPASLDFGELEVGTTSAAQTVTVRNTGTMYLVIGDAPSFAPSYVATREPLPTAGVSITGADAGSFAIVAGDCDGAALAPDETCEVTVAFAPAQAGVKTAALEFVTNAAGSPQSVALSGVGVATPEPDPRRDDPQPDPRREDPQPQPRVDPQPQPQPRSDPQPQPRSDPQPQTPTVPTPTTAAPGRGAVLAPSARGTIAVRGDGGVALPLVCPDGNVCSVSGTLTLQAGALASKSGARTAAAKVQVLARFKGVAVRGDQVRTLRLSLPKAFVKAAQKAGKRTVRATLTINTRLGSGRVITKRQQVTLVIPRARRAQAPSRAAPKPAAQQRPSFTG